MKNNIYFFCLLVILQIAACTPSSYFSETNRLETLGKLSPKKSLKVHRLDLSGENLKELPANFNQFSQLQFLNLSKNPNLDLRKTFEKLKIFEQLKVLLLDSNQIEQLPENIVELKQLTQLSLAGNPEIELAYLTDLLVNCFQLNALNLSNNRIDELPKNFIQLSQLKNLRLSNNQLNDSTDFDILGKLKLKILWLDDNQITRLPENVGNLNVVELYLDNNSITKIPQSMSGCNQLCVLYLGQNQFEKLPVEFIEMKMLKFLVMNQNKINFIPTIYGEQPHPIQAMVLDGNQLSKEELEKVEQYFGSMFLISYRNQMKTP